MTVFLEMCNGVGWEENGRERTHVPTEVALYMSKLLNIDQLREKKRLKRSFIGISVKIYYRQEKHSKHFSHRQKYAGFSTLYVCLSIHFQLLNSIITQGE